MRNLSSSEINVVSGGGVIFSALAGVVGAVIGGGIGAVGGGIAAASSAGLPYYLATVPLGVVLGGLAGVAIGTAAGFII